MNRQNILLIIIAVAAAGTLGYSLSTYYYLSTGKKSAHLPWTQEEQFEYANLLLAKGLNRAAAEEMEKYVNNPPLSLKKTELAKICYELGNIYMGLYKYENALKYFYRSEMLDKNASFKDDLNEKVVEALEKLGMSSQAEYELGSRTSINNKPAVNNKRIIARIGKREITEDEINQAINNLSPWMKDKMQNKKERAGFIRQYVANEVLYEEAKKLGIDKTAQIRRRTGDFNKQIVIQEYIKEQLNRKLHIDPSDVKLYYEANKDKYTEKGKIKIRYIPIPENSDEEQYLKRLKNGNGQTTWINEGDTDIQNIGKAKEIIEELFKKAKGDTFGPVSIKGKNYIFIVEDKKPRRIKSFDEVKDRVNYEYRLNKQKTIIDSLVKNALESKDVEIYYEGGNKG